MSQCVSASQVNESRCKSSRQAFHTGNGRGSRSSHTTAMLVRQVFYVIALASYAEVIARVSGQLDPIIEVTYELLEEQPSGTYVGNVIRDANLTAIYGSDVIDLGRLRFRFMRPPSPVEFIVDPTSGDVRTGRGRVDRESICAPRSITCTVRADVAVHPVEYFRIIRLTVVIVDINDGTPKFPENSLITLDVLESVAVGSVISLPTAVDPDSPPNSVTAYRIMTSSDDAFGTRRRFRLAEDRARDGSLLARLVVDDILDREKVNSYLLTIAAIDGGTPPRTGTVDVNISVLDANDNMPTFERDEYNIAVAENTPPMTTIVRVRAVDNDVGLNGYVTYSLSDTTTAMYGQLFAVDSDTGDVYITGNIDGDQSTSGFQLVVVARDSGPDAVPTSVTVNVEVIDINDNAPEVTSIDSLIASPLSAQQADIDAVVLENGKAGTFVAHVTIADSDSGENGRFNCSLTSDDNSNKFQLRRIYETEFQLVTLTPLDRESRDLYNVTIECTDFGIPARTSRRSVHIAVGDVNDHVPSFGRQRYVGDLFENNYIGATVVQTSAVDADLGNNSKLTYSLSGVGSELFTVDPTSGLVTASASLDREISSHLSFRVVAADAGNPSLVGSALVVVNVLDVNDNRPRFSSPSGFLFDVAENQPAGTVVGQISASDADSGPNQSIEYRLQTSVSGGGVGGNGAVFYIDPETGVLTTGQVLDREEIDKHLLTVVAIDRGIPSMSSTALVVVNVIDINDNAPEFDFPSSTGGQNIVSVSTAVRLGTVVAQLVAHDADTEHNSKIAYSFVDSSIPFRVDSETGHLIVDGDLSQSDGRRFNLVVTASDYRGLSTSTVLHIVVNASLVDLARVPNDAVSTLVVSSSGLFTGGEFTAGIHFIAVVCVAVGSGVVTIALIIAIAIVYRRRNDCTGRGKRGGHGVRQYNCRTAACMRLSQTSTTSPVVKNTTTTATTISAQQQEHHQRPGILDSTANLYDDTIGSGSLMGYGGKSAVNAESSCCYCCAASGGSGDCDRCGSQQRLLHSCTTLSMTNELSNKVIIIG